MKGYLKNIGCHINKGQRFELFIGALICVIGLVSPYYYAQYGAFFCDEPYQILVAKNYLHSPMTFISGALSNLWGKLFGFGLLTMRYYSVTIQLASLVLGCIYLYIKIKRLAVVLLISGICGFLMNTNLITYAVGWDATSMGLITCTALSLLCYQDKPSWLRLLILCGISTFAIFSRIPNVVIFPIISIFVFSIITEKNHYKQGLRIALTYVCAVLFLSVVLIDVFYGSLSNYVEMTKTNTVSNHSFRMMILAYVEDGIKVIIKLSLIYTLYRVLVITNRSKQACMHFAGTAVIIVVLYGYLRYNSLRHIYDMSNLTYAVMLMLICYIARVQMENERDNAFNYVLYGTRLK